MHVHGLMFEASGFLICLDGANMNLIEVQDTKATTLPACRDSVQFRPRATCHPQRAMDGLSSASKQEP